MKIFLNFFSKFYNALCQFLGIMASKGIDRKLLFDRMHIVGLIIIKNAYKGKKSFCSVFLRFGNGELEILTLTKGIKEKSHFHEVTSIYEINYLN